jgi:hypothetical protein
MVEKLGEDPIASLQDLIDSIPPDPMLGKALELLYVKAPFIGEQGGVLDAAREARNFIAHDGGLFDIHTESTRHLSDHLENLRDKVEDLAAGDNLLSRWIYEIKEKESPPSTLIASYESIVVRWVFDPFGTCSNTNPVIWRASLATARCTTATSWTWSAAMD